MLYNQFTWEKDQFKEIIRRWYCIFFFFVNIIKKCKIIRTEKYTALYSSSLSNQHLPLGGGKCLLKCCSLGGRLYWLKSAMNCATSKLDKVWDLFRSNWQLQPQLQGPFHNIFQIKNKLGKTYELRNKYITEQHVHIFLNS